MRHFNILAFDEIISGTTTTSAELNSKLGQCDALSLHGLIDNITGSGSVNVHIMHSSDGRNWEQKNSSPELTIASATPHGYGYDPTWVAQPLLGFVQLQVSLSGITQVHLKLWVCCRDQR